MKAGIFIASYAKDFPFLEGCLKSIRRYCGGFYDVRIAVPEEDLQPLCRKLAAWSVDHIVTTGIQQPSSDPFMRAQLSMMTADQYMPECDYIFFVGSDCLFSGCTTPEHYLAGSGVPYMFAEPLEKLEGNATLSWVQGSLDAVGIRPKHDYMRCLPLVYPRKVFEVTRNRVQYHTGKQLGEYLATRRANFSESNVLGLCAHAFCPEVYEWVHDKLPVPTRLIQFWSHAGLDWPLDRDYFFTDVRCCLMNTRGRTAREVTKRVLGEDIYAS